MSALAVATRGARRRHCDRGRAEPGAAGGLGGEPTLETLLSGVWEGLAAHQTVACPICGGEMRPAYGAHALPIGGACRDCEASLS